MKPENVTCPKCDGPMLSKVNRSTGQRFWGCAAYPKCNGTRDTDGLSRAERNHGEPVQRVGRWRE